MGHPFGVQPTRTAQILTAKGLAKPTGKKQADEFTPRFSGGEADTFESRNTFAASEEKPSLARQILKPFNF